MTLVSPLNPATTQVTEGQGGSAPINLSSGRPSSDTKTLRVLLENLSMEANVDQVFQIDYGIYLTVLL